MHPNGQDPGLSRYKLDWSYLIAEAVAELLNFCPDERSKERLISKATNRPDLVKLIHEYSRDIREVEGFDPTECHSDYKFYTSKVVESYVSFERDQFLYVGEVQSVSQSDMCLEAYGSDINIWRCRTVPLVIFYI